MMSTGACGQIYSYRFVILISFLKMIKILVILFITKLYTLNNIFKHIKKKHAQDLVKVVRYVEQINKVGKIGCQHCVYKITQKRTTSSNMRNVSIRNGTYKLKKNKRLVTETELQNKLQRNVSYKRAFKVLAYFYLRLYR